MEIQGRSIYNPPMKKSGYLSACFFILSLFLVLTSPPLQAEEAADLAPSKVTVTPEMEKCLSPLPKAKLLCDGRVMPEEAQSHLNWKLYGSKEIPEAVYTYYEKYCPQENLESGPDMRTYRFPADKPFHVLTLSGTAAQAPREGCKIPKGTQTLIELSDFIR